MTDFWINNTFQFTQFAAETMVYFERHKLIEITKVQFLILSISLLISICQLTENHFYQLLENFN